MTLVRLHKLLSEAGVASRRGGEDLIRAGKVSVNGQVIRELGFKADPAADKDGVAALQKQLDRAVGTDFTIEFGAALEKRYPVKFNSKVFDALFASGS